MIIYDSMAGQFQGPEGVKVISVPATEIATEHGAIQAANTAMFGALMQGRNSGQSHEAYGDSFRVIFAKKPWLICKSLRILEALNRALAEIYLPKNK